MDTTVIAALIGAVITFAVGLITAAIQIRGWWEEYRISTEQRRWEARLERLRSQIEELYGPLWAANQQSKIFYEIATELLPSEEGKVRTDRFTSDNQLKIWQLIIETYFIPLNAQKAELINTKSCLCELSKFGKLPESFEQFLKHQAQTKCLYQMRKLGKEYDFALPNFSLKSNFDLAYPLKFDNQVESSLNKLREDYSDTLLLYKKSKKLER